MCVRRAGGVKLPRGRAHAREGVDGAAKRRVKIRGLTGWPEPTGGGTEREWLGVRGTSRPATKRARAAGDVKWGAANLR